MGSPPVSDSVSELTGSTGTGLSTGAEAPAPAPALGLLGLAAEEAQCELE